MENIFKYIIYGIGSVGLRCQLVLWYKYNEIEKRNSENVTEEEDGDWWGLRLRLKNSTKMGPTWMMDIHVADTQWKPNGSHVDLTTLSLPLKSPSSTLYLFNSTLLLHTSLLSS